jgi:hypothetical protein
MIYDIIALILFSIFTLLLLYIGELYLEGKIL